MRPPFTYRGQIMSIHDGDTVRVDLDLLGIAGRHHDSEIGFDLHVAGHRLRLREDVRLQGCNAREITEPGGPEARAHLAVLIPVGTWVTVQTFKPDKYGGRWQARLTLNDGRDVATVMCADGYAAPWTGSGPKPTPPWPLPAQEMTA